MDSILKQVLELLKEIRPYTDSLICYASTIDEYKPNGFPGRLDAAILVLTKIAEVEGRGTPVTALDNQLLSMQLALFMLSGGKWVPDLATNEMCEAAHFGPNCAEKCMSANDVKFWHDCWSAMLSAAPCQFHQSRVLGMTDEQIRKHFPDDEVLYKGHCGLINAAHLLIFARAIEAHHGISPYTHKSEQKSPEHD